METLEKYSLVLPDHIDIKVLPLNVSVQLQSIRGISLSLQRRRGRST
jgi:hypothetical protein